MPLKSVTDAIQPGAVGYLPVAILLAVAAAVLFSWVFNWPDRVARSWRRFSATSIPVEALVRAATIESCLFVILALLGAHWLGRLLGPASVALVLPIVLGTGILLDLVREARFRVARPNAVAVWEIHQLYAVDPAMRLLAGEGIVAFARGLHFRTLLQFFGPFVPVHILVEPGQAQLARALLQSRWGTFEESARGAGKSPPALPTA